MIATENTTNAPFDLSVVLLHDKMHNKEGKIVCTSLTMIDVHDFARSSRTYGVSTTFVAHPSATLRKLANTLKGHWEEGLGAVYNPNRKEALEIIQIVSELDEAIERITDRTGVVPKLVATSAKDGSDRISYQEFKTNHLHNGTPYLLMFGTGWGMSEELLCRADHFLKPVNGPTPYNHLSVRSACAIILDRLLGI